MAENDDKIFAELELIKKLINELKDEELKLSKKIEKDNKVLMHRINKLQEYNEISDMRLRNIYKELKKF